MPPHFLARFLADRAAIWRTAETLAIAAAGGILLNWLDFPAGLVTGSLLGVAAAALCGRPIDGVHAGVARHLGAGRHIARRGGDAGDIEGLCGFSVERRGAGGVVGCDDRRDQRVSALCPRLGPAVGAVRRKSGRARAGHGAVGGIQGRHARHRHRADAAGGGADRRHPVGAVAVRAHGGRRHHGAARRFAPGIGDRTGHSRRSLDGHRPWWSGGCGCPAA